MTLKWPKVGLMLGHHDSLQSYRRSALGSFWISIGMAVQIGVMGVIFGIIFKSNLSDYVPYLATSVITWGLISMTVNEGTTSFTSSDALIKQFNLSHTEHVARTVWRNLVLTAHNLVILPMVFLVFWRFPSWQMVAFVPGLLLLVINLIWVVWLLGMLNARFRDIQPIVASSMTIAFYVTPVMWYPKLIDNNSLSHLILGLNPLYHWLQIVRLPILGQWPTWENWGLALASAGIGWIVTLLAYKKYRNMIAYWV